MLEAKDREIESLRLEKVALEEQVKLLVRTEHRLSIYQLTVQRQLERIEGAVRMFSEFDIRDGEEKTLGKLTQFLKETFLIHAAATLEVDAKNNMHRVVSRASHGIRGAETSPPGQSSPADRLTGALADLHDVTVVADQHSPIETAIAEFMDAINPLTPLSSEPGDRYLIVPILPTVGHKKWYLILATFAKGRVSHFVSAPDEKDVSFFALISRHLSRFINDRRQAETLHRERGKLAESNDALQRSLSELHDTQERLVRSTKLEAVGRLSAGVAHDFNNLLTLILGYGAEIRREFEDGSRQQTDVDSILAAGTRAAELTRQLLVFGRGRPVRTQQVDLNQVIEDVLSMLRRLLSEDIEFRCDLSSGTLPIVADPSELEQVIMNLVINAQDAMPRGGKLVLSTSRGMALLPEQLGGPKPDASVPCAILSVTDSGMGMDEETRSRVFEPFFTTKEVGEGTGMGLAIVYGVVSEIGGTIDVTSRIGTGTRFDVQVPLQMAEFVPEHETEDSTGQPVATAKVAVLEDEPGIRRLCERILSARGFDVVLCDTPREVLDMVANDAHRPDLLLLDVVMPGICGPEVARAVRVKYPEFPILFMSGHTRSKLNAHEFDGDRNQLIRKPFAPADLVSAVQRALQEPQRQPTADGKRIVP